MKRQLVTYSTLLSLSGILGLTQICPAAFSIGSNGGPVDQLLLQMPIVPAIPKRIQRLREERRRREISATLLHIYLPEPGLTMREGTPGAPDSSSPDGRRLIRKRRAIIMKTLFECLPGVIISRQIEEADYVLMQRNEPRVAGEKRVWVRDRKGGTIYTGVSQSVTEGVRGACPVIKEAWSKVEIGQKNSWLMAFAAMIRRIVNQGRQGEPALNRAKSVASRDTHLLPPDP